MSTLYNWGFIKGYIEVWMQDWINSDTEGVYMYVLYLVKGKHAVSNTWDQDNHQTADLYRKYTTTSKEHWFKDSRKFIKKWNL